jgi:hypothetical protein
MEFDTGNRPDPSNSGGSGGGTGRPPGGAAAAGGSEFDYRDPVQSFIGAVRSLVTAPAAFFRGLAGHSDLVNPLIFALICYEIYTILNALLRLAGVGTDIGFGSFLATIILAPLFAAIGLFIGAGILHLLVMLLVGSGNAGFAATFRVSSYSSVSSLVSWIPIIGWIASLYGIYLAIVGVREVHNTTTGRAALVVLIPAIVVFLLILVIVVLLGAALFFGAQQ